MDTIKQQRVLNLLKQNAPAVYARYVAQKIPLLQKEIQLLRQRYKDEEDTTRKVNISIEAMRLKEYLKLLEVEGGTSDRL